MINKLCEKITDMLINNYDIEAEDREVYIYSFNTLFEIMLNIIFSLIVSAFIGKIVEAVLLLLVLMGVRTYSGGWHAKTSMGCFILSEFSFVSMLCICSVDIFVEYKCILLIIGIICAGAICIICPISCETRIIIEEEITMLSNRLRHVVSIVVLTLVILFLMQRYILTNIISLSFVYILAMVFVELVRKRRKVLKHNAHI